MTTVMAIFSGNANRQLSSKVAQYLKIPLAANRVARFSDNEIDVEILENVRGKDVFVIQPTCIPTNDNLMELCLIGDALHRSSALRITAVIPYFGYARQDRRVRSARVPISAKVVANMLETVGFSRVLTVDLHADQIQGFFNIPVDNAYGSGVLVENIRQKDLDNLTVVSPDVGGVVRARAFAKRLNEADLAIIDKRRPKANECKIMNIIGDVRNRNCIIIDDMVDTAGTICQAATVLREYGAKSVYAYATHPVLSGDSVSKIRNSALDELIVTDTIPLSGEAEQTKKITQITIAQMLAEAMSRVNREESISCMFKELD